MSDFLKIIDEKINPLVKQIDHYIASINPKENISFYDADLGGIPTQVVLDKTSQKIHSSSPASHWITYLYTQKPIFFAKGKKYNEVEFLEYEPHDQEVKEICQKAKRVGIFGHHKDRDDIKRLCSINPKFAYFNPREVEGNGEIEEIYKRGVPILYPFLKVAESHDIDASLAGALGLRGYGFNKLYEELYSGNRGLRGRSIDPIIESINLLVSHKLDNCHQVARSLREATSTKDEAVKRINRICGENKLGEKKSRVIGNSIIDSVILGDVQVFPIVTDFELIKPFVSELDRQRQRSGFGTTVCVQHVNNKIKKMRKVSIRTSNKVDIPELLRRSHDGMTEKNYGGHEMSGGFIASDRNTEDILRRFLEKYFSEIGNSEKVDYREISSI